jgi:cellulose synthase/poly-beta-1,6-N-acetylglucosamine synthase-like glycosyltransferase
MRMQLIHLIILLVFWACAAGVFYGYVAYPLLLCALARLFGRRRGPPGEVDANQLPSVALLIAAYNEQAVIEDRIRNALQLDYPREKLQIVVASDGSSDATAQIVRNHAGCGVRLIDNVHRRGKAAVLNSAITELSADILILSDANTHTDPQAARSLVRWFANPRIGAVCGRLILKDPVSGKNVDSLYWRYETFLKRRESDLGALLGSNGAIYAIRRTIYCPIPDQTIVDDFVIPLLAKVRFGCDIIYDPEATAAEESAPDVASEFRRRSRIGAGGWQAIGILWRLLNPLRGWVAFTFWSHKVLRWLCPFCLLLMLVSNAILAASSPAYGMFLAVQLLGYGAALAGAYAPRRTPLVRLLRLANMFVAMNAALFVGFIKWVAGWQRGTWNRTRRVCELRSEPAA